MRFRALVAFLLAIASFPSRAHARESFIEEVYVQHLPDDAVVVVFAFTRVLAETFNRRTSGADALANALQKSNAVEIEVAFARGRWRPRRWGRAPVVARAVGAEIAFAFERDDAETSLARASALTTLGAMFCASLKSLTTSHAMVTQTLTQSSRMSDASSASDANATRTRAALPHEAVCVENLAPILSQLPCGARAGLGKSLKRARDAFAASHLTLEARATRTRSEIRVERTLMMVLPKSSDGLKGVLAIIHDAGEASCVASSKAYAHVREAESVRTYDLSDAADVAALRERTFEVVKQSPTMYVERFLTGTGNEFGGIVIDVERAEKNYTRYLPPCARVRLFQPLPWFVKLYMHTLVVEINGVRVERDDRMVIEDTKFVPSEDRARSSVLEMQIMMSSSASTLRIRVDYDKGFLRAHEFPPDANRGFDLPPAELSVYAKGSWNPVKADVETPLIAKLRASPLEIVHMNPLLLLLPTPDFSMSFNVAALTGSVFSIIVVSTIRTLTSRPDWRDYPKQKAAQRRALASKAPSFIARALGKFARAR